MKQTQFLEVIDRDEAERRFRDALGPLGSVSGSDSVALEQAIGRVLAEELRSPIDVTGFDRSLMDGFAVRAADTVGADEEHPAELHVLGAPISPGQRPDGEVPAGCCMPVATGAMIPRGADAVLMLEHSDDSDQPGMIRVLHAVAPGSNIAFAGTDISRGQAILFPGTLLSSREIGVAAALGRTQLSVIRRPRVAVLSTGNEIVPPGEPLPPACLYDSNAAILAAAIEEAGGTAVPFGIVPDDLAALRTVVSQALECDAVVLSGGTSKGEGDLCAQMVRDLCEPGIVVHGVALKPGKPVCLAVHQRKPVFVLPGFPTSAVFTFHEFAAPVIRRLAGRSTETAPEIAARLPHRFNSQRGRTEYVLVNIVDGPSGPVAWPLGAGSGSVTTFSLADGFLRIDRHTEFLEADAPVQVQLLSPHIRPADLVFAGSHCSQVEQLLAELRRQGLQCKPIWTGSLAGLRAVAADECDVAGIHLLDPNTGQFNRPFVQPGTHLIAGYRRVQGIVCRHDDPRFDGADAEQLVTRIRHHPDCRMIGRNSGSGTRMLIDRILDGCRPPGYTVQPASHNAICAAVEQQRADWGIAIASVAQQYDVKFVPLADEQYDFVIPERRRSRPAVVAFCKALDRMRSGLQSGSENRS